MSFFRRRKARVTNYSQLARLRIARAERAEYEPVWLRNLAAVAHADWYLASLEAGRALTTRAEIIHFARNAKQRLQELEPEPLRLQQPLRQGERLTASRGAQHRRRGEHLHPEALMQLALQGATLALLLHLLILARRALGGKP